jgi:hypothetical protein
LEIFDRHVTRRTLDDLLDARAIMERELSRVRAAKVAQAPGDPRSFFERRQHLAIELGELLLKILELSFVIAHRSKRYGAHGRSSTVRPTAQTPSRMD